MDIQSSVLNELFVLYPLIIQGSVTQLKPDGIAHVGVSRQLVAADPRGLEILADPWSELLLLSSTMAVDDRIDLYVEGNPTPATGKTIAPGEEQLRVRLYLLPAFLKQGVNWLYYVVTRVSGNTETSRKLSVLYNLRPSTSLTLVIPPDVLANGVDAARAALGVLFTFTYSNRRPFDRIEFLLGDFSITFEVPDAPAPITLTLFTDAFEKAVDNPDAVAEFHVIDQLGNRVQSPEQTLDIHLGRLDLPAPTVKSQTGNNFSPTQPEVRVLVPKGSLLPGDKLTVTWTGATAVAGGSYTSPQRLVSAGLEIAVPRSVLAYSLGKTVTVTYTIERNGLTFISRSLTLNILTLPSTALIPPKILEADANNVLDVLALGTKNATIHALLWTLIEDGQPCWMRLEGKKSNGTAHALVLWNGLPARVNQTWVNQGFWLQVLLNSYLKELGDNTQLTIKFKASLDKSNVETQAVVFPDRTYTIRALALVAPAITAAHDSKGVAIANGGTTSDTSVKLTGTANALLEVEIFDGTTSKGKVKADASGKWTLTVTGLALATHVFTAKALYGSSIVSPSWSVIVAQDVAPVITSLKGTINTIEIPNGATTSETIVVLTGTANKDGQVEIFDGSVSKGKVTANASGSWTLTVSKLSAAAHSFTVKALYGSGKISAARTLTVRVVLSENFDSQPKRIITDSQSFDIPSMKVTLLSGGGQMGIAPLSDGDYAGVTSPPISGSRSGQLLHMNYQHTGGLQRIRLDFKSAYSKVSFWHTWAITNNNHAFYYNATGQLLGQLTLGASSSGVLLQEFSAVGITRIEVDVTRAADWMAFDHFTMLI